jgi:hypothetical protein
MAKKKKIKGFSVVKAVKEMARDRIGSAPVGRVVPDRKKKRNSKKQKVTLSELLGEG